MDLFQIQQLIANAISDNNVHIQQMIKDANEHNKNNLSVRNTIYLQNRMLICGDPFNIKLIPISEQTEELCEMAVRRDGSTLQYIENQTENICKYAIMENPYALRYVKNQTQFLCKLAVSLNNHVYKDIKEPTKEMYDIAFPTQTK